jgi:hypothetical protein
MSGSEAGGEEAREPGQAGRATARMRAGMGSPGRPGERWLAAWTLIAGLAAFAACFLLMHGWLLPDTDSYYHLAIGREVAAHGVLHDLPWVRFSAFQHGFGDKELLFHWLLAPFGRAANRLDPRLAGALALAFFVGLLGALLAFLGARAAGWPGLALPFFLVYAATTMTSRWLRLRPELLSLFLLLLVLWSIVRRRPRWVGALSALYALSYTAFHALLGLVGLIFLFFGVVRRRWQWEFLLYAVLGVGIGLVAHPNFPKNLEIWMLQSTTLLPLRDPADVGTEIFPALTTTVLFGNLAWFLAAAALWQSPPRRGAAQAFDGSEGSDGGDGSDGSDGDDGSDGSAQAQRGPRLEDAGLVSRAADAFGVAAGAFGLLYLLSERFATYFYPLAALWLLFDLRRRGRAPGWWITVGGHRLPLAAVLAVCLLAGWPAAARELRWVRLSSDPGPRGVALADRAALSRALPPGARVAAHWGHTPIYLFWAPQAFYLNVLDPVFMAVPFPAAYACQRAVFDGSEPDVPLAVEQTLASDYVACDEQFPPSAKLLLRLAADPRAASLHRGFNAVFRLLPAANRGFVLDWRAERPRAAYPRLPSGQGGLFEGYVDARRLVAAGTCLEVSHAEELAAAAQVTFELAPSGPSQLAVDGKTLVATAASLHAILGRGLIVRLALPAGRHLLSVVTCPDAEFPARTGFYLLARVAPAQEQGTPSSSSRPAASTRP